MDIDVDVDIDGDVDVALVGVTINFAIEVAFSVAVGAARLLGSLCFWGDPRPHFQRGQSSTGC